MPSKNELKGNKQVVKYRTKKEQTELAKNKMRQTSGEALKKGMSIMKKKRKDKRSQMSKK